MVRSAFALALSVVLFGLALAGEGDRWSPEPPAVARQLREMGEEAARGGLGPAERELLRFYQSRRLARVPMNALESARYSIAELLLRRGEPKSAIAELDKVLASTDDPLLRDITNINTARIYREWLYDHEAALAHLRKVTGPLAPHARRAKVDFAANKPDPEAAAAVLHEHVAQARERGEKLALLHRLAALYVRANMPLKAIETYRKIVEEFPPEAIAQICQQARQRVAAVFDQMMALHRAGREEEAEALEERLDQMGEGLGQAARWDELRAHREAVRAGFQRLRQFFERLEREEEREEQPRRQGEL